MSPSTWTLLTFRCHFLLDQWGAWTRGRRLLCRRLDRVAHRHGARRATDEHMIGDRCDRQTQKSCIGQRRRPRPCQRREHEHSTPYPKEQPSNVTMRPKSDNAPDHCHDRTHCDPIQGVFCPREQRAKAERKPDRGEQREATGSCNRCNEGTECAAFIQQMFHRRLLSLCTVLLTLFWSCARVHSR